MNKAIESQIKKIYDLVFKRVYSKANLNRLLKQDRSSVMQTAELLNSSKDYNEFARKYSKILAKKGLSHQRGLWRKYFFAAKNFHHVALPKTFTEFEQQIYTNSILHNFKMIKSIPQKTLEVMEHKYTQTLIEQVAKNKLPRGSFEKELKAHGAKNARVIARTETAKLQSSIVENRAKLTGSVAYFWLSSNDQRTRPSHKEMNGVVVFFREDMQKPLRDNMRGNAGEFPNCRCTIIPIFDESDLTKSNYKVYDYKTDKIISMSKSDLLKALENKQL